MSGTVTLELRRGDDYTIRNTQAEFSAYDPDKLSMEKTEGAFTPEDRIGALEMQTLGVLDNRNLLRHMLDVTRQMRGPESSDLADLLEQSSADPKRLPGSRSDAPARALTYTVKRFCRTRDDRHLRWIAARTTRLSIGHGFV